MSPASVCYIGLGSNLNNPARQIQGALKSLDGLPDCELVKVSAFYKSRAVGPGEQGDYINAAAQLQTTLAPDKLLQKLQAIENQHGRIRQVRWGPRTLDLDLLLFDALTLDTEILTLPHPRIGERDFVLRPLLDISPDLALPNGTLLRSLLDLAPDNQLALIDNDTFERLAQEQHSQ